MPLSSLSMLCHKHVYITQLNVLTYQKLPAYVGNNNEFLSTPAKKSGLSRVFKTRSSIFAIYLSLNISRQMRYFHTYTFEQVASLHVAAIDNEFSSTPASKTSQPSHDGVDDRDQTRAELFTAFVIPLQTWHLGKASLGYTWWEKEIYWYPLMKIVEVIHGSEATCMLGSMMYMW